MWIWKIYERVALVKQVSCLGSMKQQRKLGLIRWFPRSAKADSVSASSLVPAFFVVASRYRKQEGPENPARTCRYERIIFRFVKRTMRRCIPHQRTHGGLWLVFSGEEKGNNVSLFHVSSHEFELYRYKTEASIHRCIISRILPTNSVDQNFEWGKDRCVLSRQLTPLELRSSIGVWICSLHVALPGRCYTDSGRSSVKNWNETGRPAKSWNLWSG